MGVTPAMPTRRYPPTALDATGYRPTGSIVPPDR
jgi:hypothetical protein